MLVLLRINFLLTFSHCVFTHIFKINQNGNVTLQIRFCEKVTQIRLFPECIPSVTFAEFAVSSASPLRDVPAWLFYASDWLLTRSLCFVPHSFVVANAENFHGVASFSIRWSFVFGVRYLWRHNLTSYFMFPNQRFGEICWHNMRILLHLIPLFYVSLNINYQSSREDIGGK